jgi:hypothetical protein
MLHAGRGSERLSFQRVRLCRYVFFCRLRSFGGLRGLGCRRKIGAAVFARMAEVTDWGSGNSSVLLIPCALVEEPGQSKFISCEKSAGLV